MDNKTSEVAEASEVFCYWEDILNLDERVRGLGQRADWLTNGT